MKHHKIMMPDSCTYKGFGGKPIGWREKSFIIASSTEHEIGSELKAHLNSTMIIKRKLDSEQVEQWDARFHFHTNKPGVYWYVVEVQERCVQSAVPPNPSPNAIN